MVLENKAQVSFKDALYKGICLSCESRINWEADFDADGTTYHATCCGSSFYMSPATVNIEIEGPA